MRLKTEAEMMARYPEKCLSFLSAKAEVERTLKMVETAGRGPGEP